MEVDRQSLRAVVEALPPRRSRLHAPDIMARADEVVLAGFRAHGWDARIVPFTFRDAAGYRDLGTLRRGDWGPVVYERLAGANVIAVKEGDTSRDAVVVLAHHDVPRDLPGADDNAAGVAVIVELARLLADTTFERTVVLAAVDMEEIGMFGSRALVEHLATERRVLAGIAFDTIAYTSTAPGSQLLPPGLGVLYPRIVGRLRRGGMRGDWAAVLYRGFALDVARAMERALEARLGRERTVLLRDPGDLPLLGPILRATLPMVRQFARSDHLSFWNARIPAVVVTDTTFFRNPHYHQLTDTPDTLDYEQLAGITLATADAVSALAGARPEAERPVIPNRTGR